MDAVLSPMNPMTHYETVPLIPPSLHENQSRKESVVVFPSFPKLLLFRFTHSAKNFIFTSSDIFVVVVVEYSLHPASTVQPDSQNCRLQRADSFWL